MKNLARILLIPLILFASLLPFVSVVHAAGPTFVQGASHHVITGSTDTVTLAGVAIGNEIVLVTASLTVTANNSQTAGDNQGQASYTSAVIGHDFPAGEWMNIHVWISPAKTSASGSYTFTVTNTGGTVAYLGIEASEWSGLGPFVDNTASKGAVCAANPFPTLATTTFPNNVALIGVAFSDTSAANPSAGAGFTLIATSPTSGNGAMGGQYDAITGGSGSTTFPMGGCGGSANSVIAGAVIDSVAPTTTIVTVVGPCNFFQLQCWWYPMLFMLGFSGLFLFVAGASKVSSKGALHLFLTGMTFGSIVAVIFGIMNIVFPLMLLIVNTVYVLRFKG